MQRKITRSRGVAGQIAFTITDEHGSMQLVGNVDGSPGPIVLCLGSAQSFVTDPGRFGEKFDRSWVDEFLS